MKKIKTGPDPKNLNKKTLKKGAQGTQRSLGAPLYSGGPKDLVAFLAVLSAVFRSAPASPRRAASSFHPWGSPLPKFRRIRRNLAIFEEIRGIRQNLGEILPLPPATRPCARLRKARAEGVQNGDPDGGAAGHLWRHPSSSGFRLFFGFFPIFFDFFRLFFRPCSTPSRILGSVRTPKIFPDIEE